MKRRQFGTHALGHVLHKIHEIPSLHRASELHRIFCDVGLDGRQFPLEGVGDGVDILPGLKAEDSR
jgi:hypothetical protein